MAVISRADLLRSRSRPQNDDYAKNVQISNYITWGIVWLERYGSEKKAAKGYATGAAAQRRALNGRKDSPLLGGIILEIRKSCQISIV